MTIPPNKNILIRHYATSAVNEFQYGLSSKLIKPNLNTIEKDLLSLRNAVDYASRQAFYEIFSSSMDNLRYTKDVEWQASYCNEIQQIALKHISLRGYKAFKKYPISRCDYITGMIYMFLTSAKKIYFGDGITLLQEFIQQGGILKPIWGQVRGRYFQNAMQVGSYYMDVSNDTVDINKPKVEYAELDKCDFKNIDCYTEYSSLMKSYNHRDILINNCFPALLPFFPLLICAENNPEVQKIDINLYMAKFSIANNYENISSFILNVPKGDELVEKELKAVSKNAIEKSDKDGINKLLEFRIVSTDECQGIIKDARRWSEDALISHFSEAIKATQLLNKMIKAYSVK